jgi:hypothetical protein
MSNRIISVLASAILLLSVATLRAEDITKTYNLDGTNIRIAAVQTAKSIMISLANINEEVKISLQDERGTVLVNETVKTASSFQKRYNLSNLEVGNYRLIITKNLVKTIQPFELTNKEVVMSEGERREKFLPSVIQRNDKMDVNVLLGNYSNVHVKIYANDGTTVFAESNYVVMTLHKRYDLSKLPSGSYIVEVEAGDEIEYFTVIR